MRRETLVARHRGPSVPQHLHGRLAGVDHRLDGEHHAFGEPRAAAGLAIVGHLRLLVHALADAVTDELPHDRKPERLDVPLDRVADVRDPGPRPHALDGLVERLLGDAQQRGRLFRHVADRQRDRAVAEVSVERRADIDRDDVAFLEHAPAGWDPVDHLVVDRRADRRRISMVSLERRRGAGPRDARLRHLVELRRVDARRHLRRQDLAHQPTGPAHPLELGRRSADNQWRDPPAAAPSFRASTAAASSAATRSGACAPLIERNIGRAR